MTRRDTDPGRTIAALADDLPDDVLDRAVGGRSYSDFGLGELTPKDPIAVGSQQAGMTFRISAFQIVDIFTQSRGSGGGGGGV
ncbi:hypothetical protein M446_3917 [Methylobacterium sp. 4-46]|uniref:hypothetical protein n=1 Tax=unclassified Methylobacterium TaxID=2615210 RepID=UPI000165C5B8|nr:MULTISPECIES: hypothetical protein [Methylobacterium]ACA18283.1 hypothetical protein M446_3917 [Methylobacterium sp. 4-46]WFT77582.1 hypothetical protein QA634_19900 [Methylobacterium nodulans]